MALSSKATYAAFRIHVNNKMFGILPMDAEN